MAALLPGLLRDLPPHSFTPVFVLGLLFAAADAFGIGSNDVANSFATSVGSQSLSLRTACVIAVFTEFFGAIVLGGGVTTAIKGAASRRGDGERSCCGVPLLRLVLAAALGSRRLTHVRENMGSL